MALRSKADVELSEELEAVAAAAAERLRAVGDGDLDRDADLQRTVGEAARHAIAAGVSLASIADAEQIGHERAREELGPELLRRVERAARRRREAEREYEHAVVRAGGLGLAHRDVAAAAQVAHGTVRAIIARAELTIEPVFAQTVFNRKLTRFHRRGHAAVHSEWRLITTTHNLLKRHSHRIAPTPT